MDGKSAVSGTNVKTSKAFLRCACHGRQRSVRLEREAICQYFTVRGAPTEIDIPVPTLVLALHDLLPLAPTRSLCAKPTITKKSYEGRDNPVRSRTGRSCRSSTKPRYYSARGVPEHVCTRFCTGIGPKIRVCQSPRKRPGSRQDGTLGLFFKCNSLSSHAVSAF